MDSAVNTPSSSASRRFHLAVSSDRLRVYFSGFWQCDDFEGMQAAVTRELVRMGIRSGAPPEVFERLHTRAVEEGEEIHDYCLLEGTRPGDSTNGSIEWARDFFDNSFVISEETGQIDYRKRRAQLSLDSGDLIARIIPGVQGEAGVDVYGKPLRARTPHTPTIIGGGGIRKDKETRAYYAKVDGRFRWDGRRLDVDEVCTIDGDVGLGSGDIDHKGSVIITGDVQAGATVRAKGDIEVMGVLEAADVETAGSLMVRRGIFGREGRRILVGRDVFARFIIEGHVSARGSVTAEREIINSEVVAGGEVRVPAGRAFGGRIIAHGGVETKALGSEGLVHTEITVGEDPFLDARLKPLEDEYAATRKRADELNTRLHPLLAQRERLRPDQKRGLAELLQTVRALTEEADRLRAEIQHLRKESQAVAKYRVAVRDRIFPEVVMHMKGHTMRVTDLMRGSFVFSPHDNGIGFIAR